MTTDALTPETLGRMVMAHLDPETDAANRTANRELSARIMSRGSRIVYLLQVTDPGGCRRIVVKARPMAHRCEIGDASLRAEETVREYKALEAAYLGLNCDAREKVACLVPRPLAAIPDHGLLCMDVCPGRPLRALVRQAVILPWKRQGVERTLERCGEWLKRFTSIPFTNAANPLAGEDCALPASHQRPYIYALLGLHGLPLIQQLVDGATGHLLRFQYDSNASKRIVAALHQRCGESRVDGYPLVAVHGKYSTRDIFVTATSVSVVDFEYSGRGTSLNDLAFLTYELFMVNRWNMSGGDRVARRWRDALVSGFGEVNRVAMNCFVAYFMIHSLKPGSGVRGVMARRYAQRWLTRWLRDPEA